MKKISSEFKVGLFIILCILALFYLTYSTGKLDLKKSGYHIYVVFNEVAGLNKKAPVMLNGLEVGKVEDIKLAYDDDKTTVVLKLWIDSQAKIRENAAVSIKTLGLMGEKFIQISAYEGKNFIQPQTTLVGKAYLDLDAMMEQLESISKDLSQQMNKLMASINTTIEDNKNNITQIIKNLEEASGNFKEFSDDIKRHPWKLLFKTKEKPKETQEQDKERR